MFYEVYNKRRQVLKYDPDREPGKDVIQKTLEQANHIVASKQNLMPYKIYVVGPYNKEINEGLFNLSQEVMPTPSRNFNLSTAPYQFIYTLRLQEGNSESLRMKERNHVYLSLDPKHYNSKTAMRMTSVEVGMHAVILSKLLIEQGLDVSYTLCIPNWEENKGLYDLYGLDFIEHEIQLVMSTGYLKPGTVVPKSKYIKPLNKEIIEWI